MVFKCDENHVKWIKYSLNFTMKEKCTLLSVQIVFQFKWNASCPFSFTLLLLPFSSSFALSLSHPSSYSSLSLFSPFLCCSLRFIRFSVSLFSSLSLPPSLHTPHLPLFPSILPSHASLALLYPLSI